MQKPLTNLILKHKSLVTLISLAVPAVGITGYFLSYGFLLPTLEKQTPEFSFVYYRFFRLLEEMRYHSSTIWRMTEFLYQTGGGENQPLTRRLDSGIARAIVSFGKGAFKSDFLAKGAVILVKSESRERQILAEEVINEWTPCDGILPNNIYSGGRGYNASALPTKPVAYY